MMEHAEGVKMKIVLKFRYKIAISVSKKSLYKYIGNEDLLI